jgi:hypothetical protein
VEKRVKERGTIQKEGERERERDNGIKGEMEKVK